MRDKRLNCYQLVEKMNHKGWHLASLQKPPGLHLAITNYNVNLVEDFISAIKTAVAEVNFIDEYETDICLDGC